MGFKNTNMPQRPVIGVTGNARRFSPSWWCTRLAVWLAGGKAYRISTRHHTEGDQLREIDALIIGGGDDIDPAIYGGEALATEEFDRARDALETSYLKHAWARQIPILGICRGAQLLNAVRGGNLLKDIRAMRKHTTNRRRITPCKSAFIEPSLLQDVVNTEKLPINSLHYQAIDRAGDGLAVCARDEDNIIQAVCSTVEQHPAIGVQWHPEYLFYRKSHLSLFRWLVRQGRSAS